MMNSDAGLASSGKKGMAWARRFSFFVILVSLVASSTLVSSDEDDYGHCERIVENWAISSGESGGEEDKLTLKDMLFFLHVPRTGGRTYFHCFLRKLYTTAQECPRSYDRLRFDPRKPNCKLVTTHDDYSLISKLPKDRTSVVTILRNPVDRVFSTYEFSIEVAARFLVHPNLTSAKQMSSRIRTKSRGVSTLDIWPWKYLVPWMREDLFARRDARKLGKLWSDETSDVYNMEHVVMPLHEFINDPIAHEIIHNGATFQVAGLTNNSYIMESHEVRNCVRKYPVLGRLVLEVAKSRLDQMLYVGLTEDHKESARMFVNMVAAQVLSQSEDLNSSAVLESSNRTEFGSSKPDIEDEGLSKIQSSNNSQQVGEVPSADAASGKENVAIRKLMEAYEVCIASLRKSQSTRRTLSLKRIAPANFSKEARLLVPQTLLNHIVALNSLDVELYKHAQSIFVQQKQLLQNGQHIFVEKQEQLVAEKELIKTWNNLYGCSPGMIFLLAILILLMIAFVSLVCTRRRTSKLKV